MSALPSLNGLLWFIAVHQFVVGWSRWSPVARGDEGHGGRGGRPGVA